MSPATAEAVLEQYWDCGTTNPQEILVLMLWMFRPTCGVLSKAWAIHWVVVEREVLPRLSRAAVDAKEQEYRRRMAVIKGELAELASSIISKDEGTETGVVTMAA